MTDRIITIGIWLLIIALIIVEKPLRRRSSDRTGRIITIGIWLLIITLIIVKELK